MKFLTIIFISAVLCCEISDVSSRIWWPFRRFPFSLARFAQENSIPTETPTQSTAQVTTGATGQTTAQVTTTPPAQVTTGQTTASVTSVTTFGTRAPLADTTDQTFQQNCLTSTNTYRGNHGAPALTINTQAVDYAKSRCQIISRFDALSFGHKDLLPTFGENLYWAAKTGSQVPDACSAAIDNWYNEVSLYNFNTPGFSDATGHFTQLVWKSTTSFGCARCSGQGANFFETYIVCNYVPPGNVQGQFPANVSPKQ